MCMVDNKVEIARASQTLITRSKRYRLSSNALRDLVMHSRVNQCSSTPPTETIRFLTERLSLIAERRSPIGCDRAFLWLVRSCPPGTYTPSEVTSSVTAISDYANPPGFSVTRMGLRYGRPNVRQTFPIELPPTTCE